MDVFGRALAINSFRWGMVLLFAIVTVLFIKGIGRVTNRNTRTGVIVTYLVAGLIFIVAAVSIH